MKADGFETQNLQSEQKVHDSNTSLCVRIRVLVRAHAFVCARLCVYVCRMFPAVVGGESCGGGKMAEATPALSLWLDRAMVYSALMHCSNTHRLQPVAQLRVRRTGLLSTTACGSQ